jgi:hypothetical protein
MRPEGLSAFKKSPNRESNPRPSGLQHSALTTTQPPASIHLYFPVLDRFFVSKYEYTRSERRFIIEKYASLHVKNVKQFLTFLNI